MAENFDNNVYCEFPEAVAKAGKDILLCLFTSDGAKLLSGVPTPWRPHPRTPKAAGSRRWQA